MTRPFNLEEAKAGQPLITRDGRPAKFVAWVPSLRSVLGLLAEVDGFIVAVRKDGLHDAVAHNSLDLFMAPRKMMQFGEFCCCQGTQTHIRLHDSPQEFSEKIQWPIWQGKKLARVEWEE